MKSIRILISASWEDYEDLLELRGDRKDPSLAFDSGNLEIEGYPEEWSDGLRIIIQELIEDQEDLLDALAAEEESGQNERISWEEVKRELKL
jgi:hypothetical protein